MLVMLLPPPPTPWWILPLLLLPLLLWRRRGGDAAASAPGAAPLLHALPNSTAFDTAVAALAMSPWGLLPHGVVMWWRGHLRRPPTSLPTCMLLLLALVQEFLLPLYNTGGLRQPPAPISSLLLGCHCRQVVASPLHTTSGQCQRVLFVEACSTGGHHLGKLTCCSAQAATAAWKAGSGCSTS